MTQKTSNGDRILSNDVNNPCKIFKKEKKITKILSHIHIAPSREAAALKAIYLRRIKSEHEKKCQAKVIRNFLRGKT